MDENGSLREPLSYQWNDVYEKNRFRFKNFDEFMNWYNTVRSHESLDTKWGSSLNCVGEIGHKISPLCLCVSVVQLANHVSVQSHEDTEILRFKFTHTK